MNFPEIRMANDGSMIMAAATAYLHAVVLRRLPASFLRARTITLSNAFSVLESGKDESSMIFQLKLFLLFVINQWFSRLHKDAREARYPQWSNEKKQHGQKISDFFQCQI